MRYLAFFFVLLPPPRNIWMMSVIRTSEQIYACVCVCLKHIVLGFGLVGSVSWERGKVRIDTVFKWEKQRGTKLIFMGRLRPVK